MLIMFDVTLPSFQSDQHSSDDCDRGLGLKDTLCFRNAKH